MSDDHKVIFLNRKFKNNSFLASAMDIRTATTGTIALVLFIMAGVNFSLFKDIKIDAQDAQVRRGIASVPKVMVPEWKKSLTEINSGMVAEIAKKPSPIESLSFGDLEGRYSLEVKNGVVKNIQFTHQGEPKHFFDRTDFLYRHASVFMSDTTEIERVAIKAKKTGRYETYRLVGNGSEAFIVLHLDRQGRLLSAELK